MTSQWLFCGTQCDVRRPSLQVVGGETSCPVAGPGLIIYAGIFLVSSPQREGYTGRDSGRLEPGRDSRDSERDSREIDRVRGDGQIDRARRTQRVIRVAGLASNWVRLQPKGKI